MKRDWKLIRGILEALEGDNYIAYHNAGGMTDEEKAKIYKDDLSSLLPKKRMLVAQHLELLVDSGLVTQASCSTFENSGLRLTMKGYDMLDALRDDTVWNKVKDLAVKSGVTISWEFIKQAIPLIYKQLL